MDDNRIIKVTKELFKDGVYIFKNLNSDAVTLRNTKTNHSATVTYPEF